ncbi:hypothetical protein NSE_0026 [Neorickettsia sennetsu str. Miyayama]|uniref:Uncharacterized protein n=1 Tax=Ehrlichia sennetsu (strain ATCC VR-367 / Miyayama) TaxID=222891 RepID=Q2GF27_EHRS3|nr:hypothetical protein NSE_0026 [Neorickettsia sennetsu str. Miyayama]
MILLVFRLVVVFYIVKTFSTVRGILFKNIFC